MDMYGGGLCCVICGGPLQVPYWHAIYGENRWSANSSWEDQSKNWLADIRLVSHVTAADSFRQQESGKLNNISTTSELFVSEIAQYMSGHTFGLTSMNDDVLSTFQPGHVFNPAEAESLWNPPIEYTALSSTESGDVLFPIHDHCVTISQHVASWHINYDSNSNLATDMPSLLSVYNALKAHYASIMATEERRAKALGLACNTQIWQGLEYDHKYYGAQQFWGIPSWHVRQDNEWYCTSPVDFPNLARFILERLIEISLEEEGDELVVNVKTIEKKGNKTGASGSPASLTLHPSSSLEKLPLEVLGMIVDYLPTSSLIRLRRCSKTLVASIVVDQHFWQTELFKGRAIPYLWDLGSVRTEVDDILARSEKQRRWNWNGLVEILGRPFEIMYAVEPSWSNAPWELRNRCRLSLLIGDLLKVKRGDSALQSQRRQTYHVGGSTQDWIGDY